MPDTYTIYLVNKSSDKQIFWCFLERPKELVNDSGVFANSSASLAVRPNAPGMNKFVIPVQYIVGAGANNRPIGLGVQVVSSVNNVAALKDKWEADYKTVPPKEGPEMTFLGSTAPENAIAIMSNAFNKGGNENQGWFSNQSFGIETDSGFIGMSWSPNPQQTRTLTPKLSFYVSVGSYDSNSLASWNEVSNGSAKIDVPSSFQYGKCTVTYTETGDWKVTPGEPASFMAALGGDPALMSSPEYAELAALSYLSSAENQVDKLVSVTWDRNQIQAFAGDGTFISGTLTVNSALLAAFGFFILSNIHFEVIRIEGGGTRVRFSYRGDRTPEFIQSLFHFGARLFFGGA